MSDYSADLSGRMSVTTVTALFDSLAQAEGAVERLRALGVSESSIQVTQGSLNEGSSTGGKESRSGDKGFFESLGDFFFPEEDRQTYAEGLARGGYLLTVTNLSVDLQDQVMTALDDAGAVDIDEREAAWRAEGWTGGQTTATDTSFTASSGAEASSGLSYTGGERNVGAFAEGERNVGAFAEGERNVGTDETVQVVEEQLRVGRRDTSHGRVRVRSYVREEPVREDISLTEERVTIERRPVDRPVSAGEAAFQERSIELEERAEEAVVSKEARVVEEINLRKESETHTETISDTVRRTEVEIEDERLAGGERIERKDK